MQKIINVKTDLRRYPFFIFLSFLLKIEHRKILTVFFVWIILKGYNKHKIICCLKSSFNRHSFEYMQSVASQTVISELYERCSTDNGTLLKAYLFCCLYS